MVLGDVLWTADGSERFLDIGKETRFYQVRVQISGRFIFFENIYSSAPQTTIYPFHSLRRRKILHTTFLGEMHHRKRT